MIGADLYGAAAMATVLEEMHQSSRQALARAVDKIKKRGQRCRGLIGNGGAANAIVDTATRLRIDLIVLATHGRSGFSHLLLGSVAERVVRSATCPVLTVPSSSTRRGASAQIASASEPANSRLTGEPAPDFSALGTKPGEPWRREQPRDGTAFASLAIRQRKREHDMARWVRSILVPVEFDDGSQAALELAKDVAMRERAELVLLHVVPLREAAFSEQHYCAVEQAAGAEAWVEREAKERLASQAREALNGDVAYRMITRVGDPTAEILRAEKELEVDLVVMATHGRKGVWRVALGSVAEKVVRGSTCPVLTTHPAA